MEGQLLAKRLHAEKIGFKITADTRILVTGGASVNLAILQVDFIIMNFVFCVFLFHNFSAGCCRCIQRQGVHTGKLLGLGDSFSISRVLPILPQWVGRTEPFILPGVGLVRDHLLR